MHCPCNSRPAATRAKPSPGTPCSGTERAYRPDRPARTLRPRRRGADDDVTTPFGVDELLAQLRRTLEADPGPPAAPAHRAGDGIPLRALSRARRWIVSVSSPAATIAARLMSSCTAEPDASRASP
jgi:hypothetical protein